MPSAGPFKATNGVVDEMQLSDDAGQACVPNMVDGLDVLLPSSASFAVRSSREDTIVHYGQTATPEVANRAVDAALATFVTYRRTAVKERRRLLLRAAELFEANAEEAARRQMRETSCVAEWAKFTSMQTSTFCREVEANVAQAVKGEIQPSYFGYTHLVFKEPIGPVLLIPPWNASVVLCVRGIANALAAGCTVVLKASELCPWTHQFVVRTFHEAGFPPGAVNMVMSDRPYAAATTETLISHPGVRKIEFIGSEAVGKQIGMMAAKHLKPVVMELGDQSPAIVLDDADIERASQLCAKGISLHHGQVCFSTERIIVHAAVQGAFLRALGEEMKKLPTDAVAVSKSHAEKSKAALDAAIKGGAKYLIGDGEMTHSAAIKPSVLTNVDRDCALSRGEAFSPTAFLVTVHSDEEAIAEANSRSGGLSAAIFTSNQERALRIARELEFGMINVNNMTLFAERKLPRFAFVTSR